MKLVLRIFKFLAIVVIVFIAALFSVTMIKQDKVAGIFINEINKKVNTKVEFGSSKLSLLRKFPMASFEFRNILVHSSPGYNTSEFGKDDSDTLLFADVLSLDFKMADIFAGKYDIERISINRGRTVILSDNSGKTNFDIAAENETADTDEFTLNLKNVILANVEVLYYNTAIKLKINSLLKSGKLRGEIKGNNINLTAKSDASITGFSLYEAQVRQTVDIALEVSLYKSDKGYLFKKGSMKFDNIALGLTGSIDQNNVMDIAMTGQSSNISRLKDYLPQPYHILFEDYSPSGNMNLNCTFSGLLSKTVTPHFNIDFEIKNGQIDHTSSKVSLQNISFKGSVTNGALNKPESSGLKINDISFRFGDSMYSGTFLITGFNKPYIEAGLNGQVVFSDLTDFISLPVISSSGGIVNTTIRFSGYPLKKEKYSLTDLLALNPRGEFVFNNFSIGLRNDSVDIKNLSGNVKLAENVVTDNLSFTLNGQRMRFSGQLSGLPEWLAGQPVTLNTTADLYISRLEPEKFRTLKSGSAGEAGDVNGISLPDDIVFDINLKVDTFSYKKFNAAAVRGRLTYQPGFAEFNGFSMNALSGHITGSGMLSYGMNKSFISRANFTVDKIDVNESFRSFNNFSQTYIKAENLQGTLSGVFTILTVHNSALKPDLNSLIVDGRYSLKNGELVDFDPIKELSSYIELSELEDIKFSNLENEFFIRNGVLTMPQMDIKSSAADLSINGTHNFNGDYEYHIKVLLSEILSRKRKAANRNNASSEFGAIADDGLGRTSLLLKMTQTGDKYKVGYDIAAATGAIKEDFKTEKQTLKTILNQEYGWFQKDQAPTEPTTPVTEKPRFNINWDDSEE